MQNQYRLLLALVGTFLAALFLSVSFGVAQNPPPPPKPKIRTITAFINLERGRYQIQVSEAVDFLDKARKSFEVHGYTVETLRIVTQPFPEYTNELSHAEALQFFKNLDGLAQLEHLMVSIGPAYLSGENGGAQAELLADILKNTKSLYGTVVVANREGVNWPAVKSAGGVIKALEDSTPHSEGNFRFAAIANVPAYSPFFPAAYHSGAGQQFAIGLESLLSKTLASRSPATRDGITSGRIFPRHHRSMPPSARPLKSSPSSLSVPVARLPPLAPSLPR